MARMTKKLVQQIMAHTNECYKEALVESYPEDLKDFTSWMPGVGMPTDFDMKIHLKDKGIDFKSNKNINTLYLEKLKKLDSEILCLVIEADKKGKIKRSPVTIHAILDELFERAANPNKELK